MNPVLITRSHESSRISATSFESAWQIAATAGPEPLTPAARAPLTIKELHNLSDSSSPMAAETAIPLVEIADSIEPFDRDANALSKSLL